MLTDGFRKRRIRPFVWIGISLAAFSLLFWYLAGSSQSERVFASITHAPITLTEETQNVGAFSYRSIAIEPPYDGYLEISLNVVRGNPVDVLLLGEGQTELLKRAPNWKIVPGNKNFSAANVTSYHRTAPIVQGTYYLILRDPSSGLPSRKTTDVSVKIVVNP